VKKKHNSPFLFSNGFKRYHTADYDYKRRFGKKMCRIPLSAGFTCPNRDGTKGVGGCTFCSAAGGGEFALDAALLFAAQYALVSAHMAKKWPSAGHMAYLQAFSNTYCSADRLQKTLDEIRRIPKIEAIILATRADCLDKQKAEILKNVSRIIPLEVELGLQSVHDSTAKAINRCHTYDEFLTGFNLLDERDIRICVHIINSLPGETYDMMQETAQKVGQLRPAGVKLHMLHLLKGSVLGMRYQEQTFPLMDRASYVSLICDQIELFPPETVIARLTGDGASNTLIAPEWTRKKLTIINDIDRELYRRDSWQGKRFAGL
jgi:radical SAM protein (TIGR01212 family)